MANGMHQVQRRTEPERAADKPEASSSEMLAAVPDMMFRMDGDGRYLEFKPAKDMEPFVPPETLLGRRMHDVLPEGVADSGLAAVKAAIATDEAQTIVYELPMSDGPHRYEARVVPLDANEVLINRSRPHRERVAYVARERLEVLAFAARTVGPRLRCAGTHRQTNRIQAWDQS